ncbi:MAG: hypothetical protein QOE36_2315 [Gaiellaceae bacterium]|jgi:hypothetical protein|nr:hypothetical protein [Gaiellaceae bacterium]
MTAAPRTDRSEFVTQSDEPECVRRGYEVVTKPSQTRHYFLDSLSSGVALDPPGEFGGTTSAVERMAA